MSNIPQKYKDIKLFEYHDTRFIAKTKINQHGCYEWQGHLSKDGYGSFRVKGQYYKAHRYAYTLYVGEIPDGFEIDHLCRNRACVNVDHLEAVTKSVNQQRGLRGDLRVSISHCKYGHEYTPENTRYRKAKTSSGYQRSCWTCCRMEWTRDNKKRAVIKAQRLPS